MKSKSTLYYFLLVFIGGGPLLFRDGIETKTDLVITIIALIAIMFGMAKASAIMRKNSAEKENDTEDTPEHYSIEDIEEE